MHQYLGSVVMVMFAFLSCSRGEQEQWTWRDNTYSIFHGNPGIRDFEGAQQICRELDATLASVLSIEEHYMLANKSNDLGLSNVWIGLTINQPCNDCTFFPKRPSCTECRRRWRWLDGSSMSDLSSEFLDQAWRGLEPTGGHQCARLAERDNWYHWSDPPNCNVLYSVACKATERTATTPYPISTTTSTPTPTPSSTPVKTFASTRITTASTVLHSTLGSNVSFIQDNSSKEKSGNNGLLSALIAVSVVAFIGCTTSIILILYIICTKVYKQKAPNHQSSKRSDDADYVNVCGTVEDVSVPGIATYEQLKHESKPKANTEYTTPYEL